MQLRFQNRNLDFNIFLSTCSNKSRKVMSASKGRELQIKSQFNWTLNDLFIFKACQARSAEYVPRLNEGKV